MVAVSISFNFSKFLFSPTFFFSPLPSAAFSLPFFSFSTSSPLISHQDGTHFSWFFCYIVNPLQFERSVARKGTFCMIQTNVTISPLRPLSISLKALLPNSRRSSLRRSGIVPSWVRTWSLQSRYFWFGRYFRRSRLFCNFPNSLLGNSFSKRLKKMTSSNPHCSLDLVIAQFEPFEILVSMNLD